MKLLLTFIGMLIFVSGISAQDLQSSEEMIKSYARKINLFSRMFPHEKVYLHFDNTGYFNDETIWFKAYVVRVDSMQPSDLSKVLYVELLNPYGDIIETQKLQIKKGLAYGDIRLNKLMGSGFFEIRAYTRYMTNWSKECVFSRVFPIYSALKKKGDYKDLEIDTERARLRLPDYEDLLEENKGLPPALMEHAADGSFSKKDFKAIRSKKGSLKKQRGLSVRFFPEGGALVCGIESRVAFEIQEGDSVPHEVEAYLLHSRGDTLSSVQTLRESRGVFFCTPDSGELFLSVTTPNESSLFPLPKAADEGCVITMNTLPAEHIALQISYTPLADDTLGFTLQQNGRVYYLNTLATNDSPSHWSFLRKNLPSGVNQLTLFNREGRILGERMFFIAPQENEVGRITAHPGSSTISPYGKLEFDIEATPESSLSVSVRDVATYTNGGNRQNLASYMLLSSDLKGYIHNPDYYLEKDDAQHRLAADVLMLVQGWRRYDWNVMTGQTPFDAKQPIEDGLYIDGKLKQPKKKASVENVSVEVVLYNQDGVSLEGSSITDSVGNYTFNVPDCSGEWKLFLKTVKKDKAQNYIVFINRLFSPERRVFSFYELINTAPDSTNRFQFQVVEQTESVVVKSLEKTVQLKEAVVKAKAKQIVNIDWITENFLISQEGFTFYDCNAITDQMYDNGESIPDMYEWLKKKEIYKEQVIKKDNSIVWFVDDESIYERVFPYRANTKNNTPEIIPKFRLDEIKALCVGAIKLIEKDRVFGPNPMLVYMYPEKNTLYKAKGVRRTHFQGYNVPHTFYMNDYSIMPPEEDHRRTLYWNPDVKTDEYGKARVELWNNSTCSKPAISIEGINPNGNPLIYK